MDEVINHLEVITADFLREYGINLYEEADTLPFSQFSVFLGNLSANSTFYAITSKKKKDTVDVVTEPSQFASLFR